MARKTETVAVDGTQFQITQLGAVRGKALWDRIARAIGGSLGGILASAGSADDDRAAGAVLRAMASIPQDLLDDLDEAFAEHSKVAQANLFVPLGDAHTPDNVFDQTFAGAYEKLMQWRIACLKVNFASFLAKLAASSAQRKASAEPSA